MLWKKLGSILISTCGLYVISLLDINTALNSVKKAPSVDILIDDEYS